MDGSLFFNENQVFLSGSIRNAAALPGLSHLRLFSLYRMSYTLLTVTSDTVPRRILIRRVSAFRSK